MNEEQQDFLFWLTASYLGLAALGLLVAAIVIYRLMRRTALAVFGSHPLFGVDARTRVMSFGVAALSFPNVVPWVVYSGYMSFVALFNDVPRALMENWQRSSGICGQDTAAFQCLGNAGFGFLQAIGTSLGNIYRSVGLPEFPFRDVVFMATLWVFLAQVLSVTSDANGTSHFRLHGMYARLSDVGRKNFHLFVVLGIAGYLSIAAIAAIPSLQPGVSADQANAGVERLREELKASLNELDETLTAADPFSELQQALSEESPQPTPDAAPQTAGQAAPQAAPGAAPDPAGSDLARRDAQTRLELYRSSRLELIEQLDEMSAANTDLLNSARGSAITNYALSLGRRGDRERAEHFQNISDWYRQAMSALNRASRDCQVLIRRLDTEWRSWSAETARAVRGRRAQESFFPATLRDDTVSRLLNDARTQCRADGTPAGGVPARPQLGSFLGPFGFVASWLVRTESIALTLIVGLIGFGLLGSACSTFVREQRTKVGGALIEDLTGVVIRGLSAAIVVFLAVEGGLAIFSANAADPNPYVLLLTCLVAAVFSEDVWAWAHGYLKDRFPRNGASDAPAPPDTPEKPDAPSAG